MGEALTTVGDELAGLADGSTALTENAVNGISALASAVNQRRAEVTRSQVILVLPAYNEEENIGRLLNRIQRAFVDEAMPYRIIVVDDGSRDGTRVVLDSCRRFLPLTVERHPVNQGLGCSIRDGLRLAAECALPDDVVVTMDADDTHAPGLIPRMVRLIREGHDVVIASRYRAGSRIFGLSLGRRAISYAASLLMRTLFPTPGVRDYTCGFRAYRGATLQAAIEKHGDGFVTASGFQCMVDILLRLRQMHAIFAEVPMILRYDLKRGHSKMRLLQTAVNTLLLAGRRLAG